MSHRDKTFQPISILSIAESEPFFKPYLEGVMRDGLSKPLEVMLQADYGRLDGTLRSLKKAFLAGMDFESALRAAQPAFPPVVIELLVIGGKRSALDHVLQDMIAVLDRISTEAERHEQLSLLWDYHQNLPQGALICDGCLQRELSKLLRRADIEGAHEIVLSQQGEEFFHQTFLGVKPVYVKEPSHSKTIRTLRQLFDYHADNSTMLRVNEVPYTVTRSNDSSFDLLADTAHLRISFQ